jgi:hypothetical protein
MIKFGIRFIGRDYIAHKRARQRVNSKTYKMEREMPKLCAIDYVDLLRNNLLDERYRFAYTYNKQYLEWKLMKVGHEKSWQLFGDLLGALRHFKVGSGWMGGVPSGVMGQAGKSMGGRKARGKAGHGKAREIAWYGKIVERTKPLFKPTARMYRKKGWLNRGKLTLGKIGQEWHK